jgi:hypothetical protein
MEDQCSVCENILADELDFVFLPEFFNFTELFLDNIFLCGKKSYLRYFSLNLDDVCVDIEFITGNVSASLSGKEQILDFF